MFGYTCLNDVTARDIQREEKQFTRAKGFDTFCPIGPVVETSIDPMDVSVVCRVNGAERQRGHTRDMVIDPFALVAFISQVMTLLPGDVVATGTPEGVGTDPARRLGGGGGHRGRRPPQPGDLTAPAPARRLARRARRG